MFGKNSNMTNQRKLKDALLADINLVLYSLEKGKYNKALDKSEVDNFVAEMRKVHRRLDNSFGSADANITKGCEKVRESLKKVKEAANGNLIGRLGDAVELLICDIEEIVDLEAGVIDEISVDVDEKTKIQRKLVKKVQELAELEQDLIRDRNIVSDAIVRLERDKEEFKAKILAEKNVRIQKNYAREYSSIEKQISQKQNALSDYESSRSALQYIQSHIQGKIETSSASSEELSRVSFLLNRNFKDALKDPKALTSIFNRIKEDLQKTYEMSKKRDQLLDNAYANDEESAELDSIISTIFKEEAEKNAISTENAQVDEIIKNLMENQ